MCVCYPSRPAGCRVGWCCRNPPAGGTLGGAKFPASPQIDDYKVQAARMRDKSEWHASHRPVIKSDELLQFQHTQQNWTSENVIAGNSIVIYKWYLPNDAPRVQTPLGRNCQRLNYPKKFHVWCVAPVPTYARLLQTAPYLQEQTTERWRHL